MIHSVMFPSTTGNDLLGYMIHTSDRDLLFRKLSREPILSLDIRLLRLLASHVIDPSLTARKTHPRPPLNPFICQIIP